MLIDLKKGPRREVLTDAAANKVEPLLARARSERRRRPLYFDGRFLAARDLTREQDYFLARQADLGRAGGFGIVDGLLVSRAGTKIHIEPGHGVTPSGELVVISEEMVLDVGMLEPAPSIGARVGIVSRLRELPATRTGLFIVAVRPVEYEANPIAKYPTSLDGDRGVHNGDIVEATAVTLVPYPDIGEPTALMHRRKYAAKEIFVDRAREGFVADALPLAMVAIERGELRWVDPHLVRREIGAEAGDVLGVSGAPLALREAHMLQYADHLRDVLASVHGGIVASQHFLALPPAGPMPKSAIDRQSFTQRFFPAEVDVDLSVVPSDELGALLEEARLLPPIDLNDAGELRSTSVLVVVPVAREDLDAARAPLVATPRKLPSAAPNLFAKLRPVDRLSRLPLLRREIPSPVPPSSPEDIVWRKLLDLSHADDVVWYVRRKNLSKKPEIVAEIQVTRPPAETPPAETPPAETSPPALPVDLEKLVKRLVEHGVSELDARRVQPIVWDAAREVVLDLAEGSRLYGAASLVEVSQAPFAADTEAARAWSKQLAGRYAKAPRIEGRPPALDERVTPADEVIQKIFHEGRRATTVLVRSGVLPELRLALSALDDRERTVALKDWSTRAEKIEASAQAPAEKDAALRALLFTLIARSVQ